MSMNLWCEALKSVVEQNRKLTDDYRQMIREIDDKLPKKLHHAEANVSGSKKSNSGKPSVETLRAHISLITEGAKAAVEIVKTATSPSNAIRSK
jgi:hypothetical protein